MAILLYCDADGVDRSLPLGDQPVLIGRGAECTIRSEDPQVSRQHARVIWDAGNWWIEDLNSANGVYVGAERVNRAPLPPGEIAVVGGIIMQVAMPGAAPTALPAATYGQLFARLHSERKERSVLQDERNAFAKRVQELIEQVQTGEAPELTAQVERDKLQEQMAERLAAELEKVRAAHKSTVAHLDEATHKTAELIKQVATERGEKDRIAK